MFSKNTDTHTFATTYAVCIHIHICKFNQSITLSICPSVYLSIDLSTYVNVYMHMYTHSLTVRTSRFTASGSLEAC